MAAVQSCLSGHISESTIAVVVQQGVGDHMGTIPGPAKDEYIQQAIVIVILFAASSIRPDSLPDQPLLFGLQRFRHPC